MPEGLQQVTAVSLGVEEGAEGTADGVADLADVDHTQEQPGHAQVLVPQQPPFTAHVPQRLQAVEGIPAGGAQLVQPLGRAADAGPGRPHPIPHGDPHRLVQIDVGVGGRRRASAAVRRRSVSRSSTSPPLRRCSTSQARPALPPGPWVPGATRRRAAGEVAVALVDHVEDAMLADLQRHGQGGVRLEQPQELLDQAGI